MKDSLVVRPVEHTDFPAWSRLWDGYNTFYERSGPTALSADITEYERAQEAGS